MHVATNKGTSYRRENLSCRGFFNPSDERKDDLPGVHVIAVLFPRSDRSGALTADFLTYKLDENYDLFGTSARNTSDWAEEA